MNNSAKALVVAAVLAAILIVLFMMMNRDDPTPTTTDDSGSSVSNVVDNTTTKDTRPIGPPISDKPIENVELVGTVKDGGGKPLNGVSITAYPVVDQGGNVTTDKTVAGTSNDLGRFALTLRPGAYRLAARLSGYQEGRTKIALAAGETPDPVHFVLNAGLTISGYVRDHAGREQPGARVVAFLERVAKDAQIEDRLKALIQYQEIKNEVGIEATADESGWYQVSGLEQEKYRVQATSSGLAPGELRYVPAGTEDAHFALEPGGVLSGIVQTEAGQPIPGALVEIYGSPKDGDIFEVVVKAIMPPVASRETDNDGRYEFDEIGGGSQFKLVARADGFQGVSEDRLIVNSNDSVNMTLTLPEGRMITGVVFGPDGAPLEGASVRANRQGGRPRPQLDQDDTRETDDAGNFTFDTLEDANYRVVASHPDFASAQQNRVQSGQDIELHLTDGGAVSGVVTDSVTGEPIKGARVVVRDVAATEKQSVTDTNGGYQVRGVSIPNKNEATISIEAEGYARVTGEKVPVQEGVITEGQNFELDKNGIVSGIVQDSDGRPIQGVQVTAKRQYSNNVPVIVSAGSIGLSDAKGKFTIDGVFPGDNEFLEGKHPDFLEGKSSDFNLLPGETVDGVVVTMHRGGAISGIVVDERGGVIPNATVALRGQYRFIDDVKNMQKKTKTDETGAFALGNLEAGEHTIVAVADGFLRTETSGVVVMESRTSQGLRMTLTKASFISGYVLDSQNEPVRGAKVQVTDTSEGIRKESTTTDSNGMYLFDKLGPYEVELEASASGFGRTVLKHEPVNRENVNISLARLGSLSGRVLDMDGNNLRAFSVSPRRLDPGTPVSAKTFQDPSGNFTYAGLEPGRYKVVVGAPGYAVQTFDQVTIESDTVYDLGLISLDQGGIVSGYVVDAVTGDPIAGCEVSVEGGLRSFQQGVPGMKPQNRSNRRRDRRVTNSKGFFEFPGLASESINLVFRHRDYMPWTERGIASGTQDLQISLESGGVITGTVVEGGDAKANAQVLLSGPGNDQRQVTDRRGNFTFSGLIDGTYTVMVSEFGRGTEGSKLPGGRNTDNAPKRNSLHQGMQRVTVAQGETKRIRFELEAPEE